MNSELFKDLKKCWQEEDEIIKAINSELEEFCVTNKKFEIGEEVLMVADGKETARCKVLSYKTSAIIDRKTIRKYCENENLFDRDKKKILYEIEGLDGERVFISDSSRMKKFIKKI